VGRRARRAHLPEPIHSLYLGLPPPPWLCGAHERIVTQCSAGRRNALALLLSPGHWMRTQWTVGSGQHFGRRATSLLNREATCLTRVTTQGGGGGGVICACPPPRRWRPDTASVICPVALRVCDGRKRTLADMSFAVAIWSSRLAVVVAMASRDGWASTRTQRLMSCLHPANQHRPCQWRPSAPDAPMMLPSTLPARHAVQRESSNAWALACDGRRQVSAGPPSMHDRSRKAP
jgi:hypothetical protein